MIKIFRLFVMLVLLASIVLAVSVEQGFTGNPLPGNITIFSPVHDRIYDSRQVLVSLSMSSEVKAFKLSKNGGDRFTTLCRNCDSYSRKKPFSEGFNEVVIRAEFDGGSVDERLNITIDSKDPRILRTKPTKGFASGIFNVDFREDNPEELVIFYGNSIRNKTLDIENDCDMGRRGYECETEVNLTDFDGGEIEYWFELTDIVGNKDESRARKLDVDVSPPVVNKFTYKEDFRGRIEFFFNITETNFDEINYIDWNENKPKERKLCSRLKDGICEKTKRFRDGDHNLTINILDDAGNKVVEYANFSLS